MSLFVGISDGAMAILQKIVYHSNESLVEIDTTSDGLAKFIVIASAVVLCAIAIAACVLTGGGTAVVALGIIKIVFATGVITSITFPITTTLVKENLPDSFYLPLYSITPQEIFSNKIPLLDVDFFNSTKSLEMEDGTTMQSTAYQLRNTVANWYIILRDISLVALLSVLVYVGIRIMISSTASDKAKYKQMLIDWLVAICLLFAMHYIMAGSNILVEKLISVIDSTQIDNQAQDTDVKEPEMYEITDADKVDKAYKVLVTKAVDDGTVSSEESSPYYNYFVDDSGNPAGSSSTKLLWPAENFTQQARINLQLLSDSKGTYVAIGWKLIYVALVVYTIIFVFTYLKRLVYMTFLTIIAPLVALTYPIDKMNDGKAQAFNMWFREYIFNLLIQPMHFILYTILITSAMEFASQNLLYVIVALGFMIPAEKLFRRFFGFENAKTPGLLAGPAGAAIMMSGMNKIFGRSSKVGKIGAGGNGGKSQDFNGDANDTKSKIKWNDKEDAMIGTVMNNQNGQNNQNDNGNQQDERELLENQNQNLDGIHNNTENLNEENKNLLQDNLQDSKEIKNNIGENSIRESDIRLNDDKEKNSKKARIKRAAGAVGRYYGRKLKNKNTWINAGKKAGRIATKGVGAMIGGTAGAIAGITSGDPTKFVQYTTTGAIGGYTAAKNIPSPHPEVNKDLAEQVSRAYYGSDEEYDNAIHKKNMKNFQKDEKNIVKLQNKYESKEAKKVMNEVVPDYFDMGIDNIDDIMAAYELEKSGEVENRQMAAATAKYASRIGSDTTKMKKKDRDDWKKTFSSEFSGNDRVKKNKRVNPDDIAEKTMLRIDKFNKLKKG